MYWSPFWQKILCWGAGSGAILPPIQGKRTFKAKVLWVPSYLSSPFLNWCGGCSTVFLLFQVLQYSKLCGYAWEVSDLEQPNLLNHRENLILLFRNLALKKKKRKLRLLVELGYPCLPELRKKFTFDASTRQSLTIKLGRGLLVGGKKVLKRAMCSFCAFSTFYSFLFCIELIEF